MNSKPSSGPQRHMWNDTPPPNPRNRSTLPGGLELMRLNGSFYPLEWDTSPVVKSPDGYILGIEDPNGVMRPFFRHRIIVKIKKVRRGLYDIVPLTLQEYRYYNFNSDITTNTDRFIQYIGERRALPSR